MARSIDIKFDITLDYLDWPVLDPLVDNPSSTHDCISDIISRSLIYLFQVLFFWNLESNPDQGYLHAPIRYK